MRLQSRLEPMRSSCIEAGGPLLPAAAANLEAKGFPAAPRAPHISGPGDLQVDECLANVRFSAFNHIIPSSKNSTAPLWPQEKGAGRLPTSFLMIYSTARRRAQPRTSPSRLLLASRLINVLFAQTEEVAVQRGGLELSTRHQGRLGENLRASLILSLSIRWPNPCKKGGKLAPQMWKHVDFMHIRRIPADSIVQTTGPPLNHKHLHQRTWSHPAPNLTFRH
jgi:hypothetical protein